VFLRTSRSCHVRLARDAVVLSRVPGHHPQLRCYRCRGALVLPSYLCTAFPQVLCCFPRFMSARSTPRPPYLRGPLLQVVRQAILWGRSVHMWRGRACCAQHAGHMCMGTCLHAMLSQLDTVTCCNWCTRTCAPRAQHGQLTGLACSAFVESTTQAHPALKLIFRTYAVSLLDTMALNVRAGWWGAHSAQTRSAQHHRQRTCPGTSWVLGAENGVQLCSLRQPITYHMSTRREQVET